MALFLLQSKSNQSFIGLNLLSDCFLFFFVPDAVTHFETEGLSWNLLWNDPIIFFYLLLRKIFWYVFFNVQQ